MMSLIRFLTSRFSAARRRWGGDGREIDDELLFHIDMRMRENVRAGMSAGEARRDAEARFGDFESVRATCRKLGGENRDASKAVKLALWAIVAAGLTLRFAASVDAVKVVGHVLVIDAVLLRLLLRVRSLRPRGWGHSR